MEKRITGRIIKGVGGLYTVALDADAQLALSEIKCRARGALRRGVGAPLAGDRVSVGYDPDKLSKKGEENADFVIEEVLERKNSLIRPPLANLDYLFVTIAAASPNPVLFTVDKLFSICVHNGIEPIAVISKSELSRDYADEIAEIYRKAGFEAIITSAETGEGIDGLYAYIKNLPEGSVSAFSGASGVGKSTLLNSLFPTLELSTSSVSKKTERGRHTTRETVLFSVGDDKKVYIADTPGFTMLDFEQFDFFSVEDLPDTMREFDKYIGLCKYKKCSHTKEEGCAIIEALGRGEISESRHKSYVALFDILKAKKRW